MRDWTLGGKQQSQILNDERHSDELGYVSEWPSFGCECGHLKSEVRCCALDSAQSVGRAEPGCTNCLRFGNNS